MLLCDIGNSAFSFYEDGETSHYLIADFDVDSIEKDVYYICVNPAVSQTLKEKAHWIDMGPMVQLEGSYETLGIDRQVAISTLKEGVIVDAGSAITVDVVKDGNYQGGFIYPGLRSMQKAFSEISHKLDYLLNFEVSLDKMATNSQDAISYGAIVPLIKEITRLAEDIPLIVTGGDAALLAYHLPQATLDSNWVFNAMIKILNASKG